MRIHIYYDIKDGPWGGGNQFLKALRDEWRAKGIYEDDPKKADGILYNSHHDLKEVVALKKQHPDKIFVHRLDGIMSLTRNDPTLDRLIYQVAQVVSDAIIFQSQWARDKAYEIGCPREKPHRVIFNAPDPKIFYKSKNTKIHTPVRLIATSWSTNARKGFKYLKWLDQNLDFLKYRMTFVGNSPVKFKNIKFIEPQGSKKLADILREQDVYIFTGKEDACPNGLVEALHCGLPAVYLDNGSNKEIVQEAGVSFNGEKDLMTAIERIACDYVRHKEAFYLPGAQQVAAQYFELFESVARKKDDAMQAETITIMDQFQFKVSSMTHSAAQVKKSILKRIQT